MSLSTKTGPQNIRKTSTTVLDSEQPISVQEQISHSVSDILDTKLQSGSRKYSTQTVEEAKNVQLTEPSLNESLVCIESPDSELVDKVNKSSIQEKQLGVKMPLDLGTPSLVPEEVLKLDFVGFYSP